MGLRAEQTNILAELTGEEPRKRHYTQLFPSVLVQRTLSARHALIVNVVQPSPDGGRLVVNQDVNLTTHNYLALTLTAPLEPIKWWKLSANGVFFYARFRDRLADTALDQGLPACLPACLPAVGQQYLRPALWLVGRADGHVPIGRVVGV